MPACARSISARSIAPMSERPPAERGAIAITGLTAGYGETVVLDGGSLQLGAGETLALLGRNGVGTTTLAEQRALMALEFAQRVLVLDRGKAVHDGPSRDLANDPAALSRLVGVVG